MVEWLCVNKLTLNVIKTEYMLIGSRQRLASLRDNLNLSINGISLRQTESLKCLGLTVDNNLTWKKHIENITKKIKTNLAVMRKAKPYLNKQLLTNIYHAIVEPHFNYCCTVWDSIDKTLADKLQKLQNRAGRIITSAPYRTVPTAVVFSDLKWSTLSHQRQCQKAVMMHKIVNGHAPTYLREMFENQMASTNYSLRSSNNVQIPLVRTDCYKGSFAVSGAVLWNSLPDFLKNEQSLVKFKNHIKNFDFCIDNNIDM